MNHGTVSSSLLAPKLAALVTATAALVSLWSSPAAAQELNFSFTNPSFGGSPFYSDHLIATATAQRPERPTAAALSPAELFARQLQARLLSALSSGISQAITGSKAGDTGEFVLGDQRITFVNTGTEIRVTIFNALTGETTEIVVPIFNFGSPGTPPPATPRTTSVEAILSGVPSATGAPMRHNSLDVGPIEPPLGQLPL